MRQRHRANCGDKGGGNRSFAKSNDTSEDRLQHFARDQDRHSRRGPIEDNGRRFTAKSEGGQESFNRANYNRGSASVKQQDEENECV